MFVACGCLISSCSANICLPSFEVFKIERPVFGFLTNLRVEYSKVFGFFLYSFNFFRFPVVISSNSAPPDKPSPETLLPSFLECNLRNN